MTIYRLTYVSTAARSLTAQDLRALVEAAGDKNRRLGITGVLLFNDSNFLQTLEGDRTAIEGLMQAIRNDPRHTGLIVIGSEEDATRAFEGWSLNGILVRNVATMAGNDLDKLALPARVPDALRQLYHSFSSLAGAPA